MGIISKGILCGFSGTVGTVIGASWKGIAYIRSQATKRSSSPSLAQLEQQAKFGLAIRFVNKLTGLFAISFRQYANKMTGGNSALSYLIKNAISGTYPGYSIDYSKVLISRGDLPNADNPVAVAAAGSNINFAWTDNTGMGKAASDDTAILVVYCPAMNMALYTTTGATRSDGSQQYNASVFKGKQVVTWVGFISASGREIASSIFTGQLTVS